MGGFIIAGIIGALLGWLIHEIACAPLGYETDEGFFYGRPEDRGL